MTLKATLAVSVQAYETEALDLSTAQNIVQRSWKTDLVDGVDAGEGDVLFSDTRTLLGGAAEDLDLAGTLAGALSAGSPAAFARVKGLVVAASSTNTTDIVVGGDATSPWAPLLGAAGTVTLRPGAFVAVGTGQTDATGYAVTAGTGDLLQVGSSGAVDASYSIVVIGASA